MCGIVGVAGKIGVKEEQVFALMLKLDTIRGHHSTGVIAIDKHKSVVKHEKFLGTPWDFYKETDLFNGGIGTYRGTASALIGHNRAATIGDVSAENAHPFDFDDLIGVHNGTLVDTQLHKLDEHLKFDVDSQVLYHNINKNGIKETIPKTCGAYSLIWWDKKDETLQLLRNDDRPMQYRYSEDGKTIFFASEADRKSVV